MMFRKTIFLFSLVLLLGLAAVSVADLVAYWPLDEDIGGMTPDKSGNGLDGTLVGGPGFAAGMYGPAIQLDESNTQYVDCGTDPAFDITEQLTVAAWIKMDHVDDRQPIVNKEGDEVRGVGYRVESGGVVHVQLYKTGGAVKTDLNSTVNLEANTWYHLAFTYEFVGDGSSITRLYIDGEEHISTDATVGPLATNTQIQEIGRYVWSASYQKFFNGLIDDVVIFNHVLSAGEIQGIMNGVGGGFPLASSPTPRDGTIIEDTWVTLSWSPGDSAVSHDVYLGDDFSAVEQATRDSDIFRGNQTSTFYVAGFPGYAYPDGLVPGTTYYWRIDEVNDADPNSPWKGPIWSFSIPPKTAYNPDPPDGAGIADTTVTLRWTAGFGAKLHTIYFGDDFDTVADATVGTPTGTTTFSPGPLETEKVYYWRVDEFDGMETYTGDVWAFATPGAVADPQPANGAVDVAMATILSWTAADNAESHQVYLGLDKNAVRRADTTSPEYKGSKARDAESLDPGLLEPDTTYYWRVDEVYNGNPVKGPVWSFTVGAYLLIDDFESYTDFEGHEIWTTWIDGFGVADNGAQTGYLMPPYCEQTIVHGGGQSMPLLYANEAGVTNSEAALPLSAAGGLRDWTTAGVGELSLWFRGGSTNAAEPLYVLVANTTGAPAVTAHDGLDVAQVSMWTEWIIPLQAFADQGINLTDVDRIAIGLGTKSGTASPGGSGTVYIDDIRLYR
jgi:hypothetical protein